MHAFAHCLTQSKHSTAGVIVIVIVVELLLGEVTVTRWDQGQIPRGKFFL